nr:MAG TPA: hypothetical protein [Caudoviricetes sp.]
MFVTPYINYTVFYCGCQLWETKKRHLSTKGGKILRCLLFVCVQNKHS